MYAVIEVLGVRGEAYREGYVRLGDEGVRGCFFPVKGIG